MRNARCERGREFLFRLSHYDSRIRCAMFIDRIEIYHVRMPLVYPWKTAYGEDADIDSVLFRLVSGDHEGWSETTPFAAPTYSPETASTVFVLNQEVFCPLLVGRDWETAGDLL